MRLSLIANNGMTVEDHPRPWEWAELIAGLGLRRFEYFADHLDPLVHAPVLRMRSRFLRDTVKAIQDNGLSVFSAATGKMTYVNMLSHPYEDMRAAAKGWMEGLMELAAALDAGYVTGHYDCMSRADWHSDPSAAVRWVNDALIELSAAAKRLGLKGIFVEQMHRPQLQPNTIAGMHSTLAYLEGRGEVPFYPHVDVGHAACVKPTEDPRHTDRDKDPYAWLAEPFGRGDLLLVHLAQTDEHGSRHWPFTADHNARGLIDADRVLAALKRCGVAHAVCSLEVFFGKGVDLPNIRRAMTETVDYWRTALERAGFAESQKGEYEWRG
jgi:sugar phosphate isomerase/epimerase